MINCNTSGNLLIAWVEVLKKLSILGRWPNTRRWGQHKSQLFDIFTFWDISSISLKYPFPFLLDTFSCRAEIGTFCVFNRCVKFSYGPCCWQFGDIKATLAALQQDGRIASLNPVLHYITWYHITSYIVLHWWIGPCCCQFDDIKPTLAALQQDGRIALHNPILHYITWYYIIFYIVLHCTVPSML